MSLNRLRHVNGDLKSTDFNAKYGHINHISVNYLISESADTYVINRAKRGKLMGVRIIYLQTITTSILYITYLHANNISIVDIKSYYPNMDIFRLF